jgi:hypothetical protein
MIKRSNVKVTIKLTEKQIKNMFLFLSSETAIFSSTFQTTNIKICLLMFYVVLRHDEFEWITKSNTT